MSNTPVPGDEQELVESNESDTSPVSAASFEEVLPPRDEDGDRRLSPKGGGGEMEPLKDTPTGG